MVDDVVTDRYTILYHVYWLMAKWYIFRSLTVRQLAQINDKVAYDGVTDF